MVFSQRSETRKQQKGAKPPGFFSISVLYVRVRCARAFLSSAWDREPKKNKKRDVQAWVQCSTASWFSTWWASSNANQSVKTFNQKTTPTARKRAAMPQGREGGSCVTVQVAAFRTYPPTKTFAQRYARHVVQTAETSVPRCGSLAAPAATPAKAGPAGRAGSSELIHHLPRRAQIGQAQLDAPARFRSTATKGKTGPSWRASLLVQNCGCPGTDRSKFRAARANLRPKPSRKAADDSERLF